MVKRPAILLLILLAVVVCAYLILRGKPGEDSKILATPTTTSLLEKDVHGNLVELSVEDLTTGGKIGLKRFSDGKWIITEPEEGPADQGKVTAAETQLLSLSILNTMETGADLSTFGLTSPSFVISMLFEDGTDQALQIGNKTPTNSGYYVEKDGKVHVVAIYAVEPLLNLVKTPPLPPTPTSTPIP